MSETTPELANGPLGSRSSTRIDAYWRAANYLSVGQIYLLDNPLLREPLTPEHVKPRLLGHWGTTPGLNLLYAHLNRVIAASATWTRSTSPGPGTAARRSWPTPGSRAPTREVYPRRHPGRGRACGGCSGSSPSPAASRATSRRRRPGSIHEGGELGYSLVARLRRRVRQPRPAGRLRDRRRRGRDRPAGRLLALEQVPRPGRATARCCRSCTSTATRSPTRRCWPGSREDELRALLRGLRPRAVPRRRRRPATVAPAAGGDARRRARRHRRDPARGPRAAASTRAPALADDRAAHPEGLDRPDGGRRPAGRGHLARPPGAAGRRSRDNPEHLRAAEEWMRSLPARGAVRRRRRGASPSSRALAPDGRPADGRQPARQRRPAAARPARCPTSATYAVDVPTPGATTHEATRVLGGFLRDVMRAQRARRNFRLVGPDETASNRLGAVFDVTDKAWQARAPAGRRAPRARRPGDGDPVRAHLPGLAGGLPADRPARAVLLLRGVHPHRRLDVQPARQVAEGHARHPVAARRSPRSTTCSPRTCGARTTTASPPGPRLHRPRRQQEGRGRPGLPAAGRQHACCRWPTTACAAATTST